MTQYQQKANTIITDAIKSAIFIDEKALSFYGTTTTGAPIEEQLSIDLFTNFKENGISLAVHKFLPTDVSNDNIKNYLFEDRDLVLLDWELGGEKFSLQLLADIVDRPHIHFCAIYTSNANFDEIFNNIISYFSGKTSDELARIVEDFDAYETELKPILEQVNIDNVNSNGRLISGIVKIPELLNQIKINVNPEPKEALKFLKIAFDFNNEFVKSDVSNKPPDIIDRLNKVIVIDNTIITILQKDKVLDKDTKELIKKLSIQIADSNNSFTQLLGLEMQNIFSRKGAFIDSNLFKVSKKTLTFHRNNIKNNNNESDLLFTELMKNVLMEHASMNINSSNLAILEEEVFEALDATFQPLDEEIIAMNIFYNSIQLAGRRKLNFGDVFKDSTTGSYYICITALCDCLRPESNKNIYFFAEGKSIPKNDALKIGDSGFISFLPSNEVVSWAPFNSISDTSIHKYLPIYIKPLQFHVMNADIDDNKIEITRIINRTIMDEEIKGSDYINVYFEPTTIYYETTIKTNYAQRIANHAFAHPVRVGVDFVKKG